jgi:hypothetical protein
MPRAKSEPSRHDPTGPESFREVAVSARPISPRTNGTQTPVLVSIAPMGWVAPPVVIDILGLR